MPALIPSDYIATITWLGVTSDRSSTMRSEARDMVDVSYDGFVGEARSGLMRASCPRVTNQYPQGTEIRNTRQISILSAEEMAEAAATLKLDALDPAWLGASLIVEGIPDFTRIPPSSRLLSENGTCFVIDMENRPCNITGREVERAMPGHGIRYKQAATGKRGVTAWVEHAGTLKIGDELRLFVPDQPAWNPTPG
ncbi:MOSC domain-containing protein [Aliiroseovarius sp. S1123]|uniref:MOSC domain-containing protein n=1 Tax=unclassified Aliiroseovarius TaxID=2623558 RepID=UPI001FF6D05C|nr:MOSC domain-containing protein [Aliiroseovarius sp. S1123]MCK0169942.1 MOSC domain-containing protein [Aliiroseovarius sp. S1123]